MRADRRVAWPGCRHDTPKSRAFVYEAARTNLCWEVSFGFPWPPLVPTRVVWVPPATRSRDSKLTGTMDAQMLSVAHRYRPAPRWLSPTLWGVSRREGAGCAMRSKLFPRIGVGSSWRSLRCDAAKAFGRMPRPAAELGAWRCRSQLVLLMPMLVVGGGALLHQSRRSKPRTKARGRIHGMCPACVLVASGCAPAALVTLPPSPSRVLRS